VKQRRQSIILITAIVLFLLSCVSGLAHSGRTDSKGGHYDRSSGEYHYHHGYSAHQHPNGVCPYDYKEEQTTKRKTATPKSNNSSSKKKSTEDSDFNWGYVIAPAALIGFYAIPFFIRKK
jgi:hypothetical protein